MDDHWMRWKRRRERNQWPFTPREISALKVMMMLWLFEVEKNVNHFENKSLSLGIRYWQETFNSQQLVINCNNTWSTMDSKFVKSTPLSETLKPYKCSQCDFASAQAGNLRRFLTIMTNVTTMTMPATMTKVMMMTTKTTKTMIMIEMMTASAPSQFSHSSWPAWLCEKLQEEHQDSDLAHPTTVYLLFAFPCFGCIHTNTNSSTHLLQLSCLSCFWLSPFWFYEYENK